MARQFCAFMARLSAVCPDCQDDPCCQLAQQTAQCYLQRDYMQNAGRPAGLPACRPAGLLACVPDAQCLRACVPACLRAACPDRRGREGRAPGVSVTAAFENNFSKFFISAS